MAALLLRSSAGIFTIYSVKSKSFILPSDAYNSTLYWYYFGDDIKAQIFDETSLNPVSLKLLCKCCIRDLDHVMKSLEELGGAGTHAPRIPNFFIFM